MPRRKVHPANRVRAVQACSQCRSAKRRCNGQLPCSLCIRRGKETHCTFGGTTHASESPGQLDPAPSSRTSQDVAVESEEDSPGEARHRINPRLLSNSHGERVFIGSSASLAFLQFIRELVAKSMPASEFTESPQATRMLEANQPTYHQSPSIPNVELNDAIRLQYGQNFRVVTSGVLGFVNDRDLEAILYGDAAEESHTAAISNMIIAIGAQAAPSSLFQARVEQNALASAQATAFADLLQNPSLAMVQLFLLLAFYMLQACQRNAAFMYIGVASRAAYTLGLSESQEHTAVWRSVVNLDIIVSSILGRVTATTILDQDTTMDSALDASYRLSLLVHDIVNNVYKHASVSTPAVEKYLSKLDKWTQSLPTHLRISGAPQDHNYQECKHVSGSLNISCYYHFAVILVCRPFLVSHLLNCMLNRRALAGHVTRSGPIHFDVQRRDVAEKCVLAATYMAQTCHEVLEADFLLESAPLMKAWVFAAGLVLGLQMFAVDDYDPGVATAFRSARKVLQRLGTRSSQATQYFDILSHLEGVINKKKDQQNGSSRHKNVERLVDFSNSKAVPMLPAEFELDPMFIPPDPSAEINNLLDNMQNGVFEDDVLLGWDQLAWQF